MSGTPSSDAPIISPDEPYNPDAAPADAPAPAPEAAAWVATLRIMMNMDEFITRE